MGKIGVPYLVIYENKDGSKRFYFAPRQDDRQKGWATVRLHDKQERPIRDPLKAAEACKAVAEIYMRWRAGELGYGPWRIDKLGRVVEQPSRKDRKPKKQFRPGQIGAMVADYMDHDVYMSNTEKTKAEYKIYLDIFVEKFGESYWRKLAPGVVREWLLERAASGGPAGAHALYRTARAFFGRSDFVTTPSIIRASCQSTKTRCFLWTSSCQNQRCWFGRAPLWKPSSRWPMRLASRLSAMRS